MQCLSETLSKLPWYSLFQVVLSGLPGLLHAIPCVKLRQLFAGITNATTCCGADLITRTQKRQVYIQEGVLNSPAGYRDFFFFFFFFFARPDFRGYVSGFSQFSLSCGVNRAERGVTAFSWPKWNESLPNIIAKHLGSSTIKE